LAIVAKFAVTGMNTAKYDEIIRQLEANGLGAPNGRLYHVCYGDPDNLQVIDIFESPEQLAAFGAGLAPLLEQMGVQAAPTPAAVHNIIAG
jgi:hypothetical protein